MKKIAIITGASSGIGKVFAQTIKAHIDFDELWIIARRTDRLEELKKSFSFPTKTIGLDLSDRLSYEKYNQLLSEEKQNGEFEICMLINCSGYGKFNAINDIDYKEYLNMMDVNCGAIISLCQISLPYMNKGSTIINIASIAALQPCPYITVYSATKSLVLSYTRSLNVELKKYGIRAFSVCPYWTKTEFFDHAIDKSKEAVVKKYVAMYKPEEIVARAWKDLKTKKDVSICGFIARTQARLVKIFSHKFVMNVWMNQQKLK